jgi:hypothetical protein
MADKKISALTGATTPLAGTEVLPIVQGGATVNVSVTNLTSGRAISATQLTLTTGNLSVANGQGIDFSDTSGTGTSELLADYEEGTFTAVITMGSGTATVSSTNDLMSYTKVGRLVTINGQFGISATSTPSGTMKITLPFSVANGSEGAAFSVGGAMRIFNQVLPVGLYPIIQANNNDNTATFFMVTSAGTLTDMLPIADGFFMISLTYIV